MPEEMGKIITPLKEQNLTDAYTTANDKNDLDLLFV